MSKNQKVVDIGLDIGIASVGWAITNSETLEIVKHGVRLFSTVDDPKDSKLENEVRREARSARRQVNRRRTLKRDFIKFLIESGFIDDIKWENTGKAVEEFRQKYINNPSLQSKYAKQHGPNYVFYLRKKGLTQKLDKNELTLVLYWYLLHRGFKYEIAEEQKEKMEQQVQLIQDKYKDAFPVEGQIAFLETNGYLNGTYNRHIKSSKYVKEINQIFSHQDLNKEFKDRFLSKDFFLRQRSFEQGPGNEKTHTEYGIYQMDPETHKIVKKYDNIWEKTIGKCSFYPKEYRAPKNSLTGEIFNLLNDLNNITLKDHHSKLTTNEKVDLIKIALKNKACQNKIIKGILKLREMDKDDNDFVSGYDKQNPKAITQLTSYHAFIKKGEKLLPENFYDFEYLFQDLKFNKENIFDQIIDVFSKFKTIEDRKTHLTFLNSAEEIDKVVNNVKDSFSKTHSLSYKAMQEMIDLFIKENLNQMEYAHQNEIDFRSHLNVGSYYLKTDWIEEIVASPTVKRSFRQTTKILNAIFEKAKKNNWKIGSIIIEMARESNNKQTRDKERDRQKYFENLNKQIDNDILSGYPDHIKTNTLKNKIWFLMQQKGRDAYDGETIELDQLINNPGAYDLDHIIPRSQSFSNSRSNIVLTKNLHNGKKKNNTPYQYLPKEKFASMKKLWEEWYKPNSAEKDRKHFEDKEKLKYLTTDIDFKDPNNQFGFIQRNLVDTRYITREILKSLIEFKKSDKNPFDYKVKTVNGKMTSFIRNKLENNLKDRSNTLKRPEDIPLKDENGKKNRNWHGHHAEDAYIVTIINSEYGKSKAVEHILNSEHKIDPFLKYDQSTGEVKDNNEYANLINKVDVAREELNKNLDKLYFSRMVEKKQNIQLYNETLYASKYDEENNTFSQMQRINLLDLSQKEAQKYFSNNSEDREKLQIFKHNKNLWKALAEIYNNYSDEKLPFKAACEEAKTNFLKVMYQSPKGKEITNTVKKITVVKQSGKKGKNPLRIVKASNNNGNSFYEGLNWISIQVYKDAKDKYKILTIDASNHTFIKKDGKTILKPKEDMINKQKEFKDIPLDNKPEFTLNRGNIFEDPNGVKMWVCGCHWTQNRIELKFLSKITQGRIYKSINSILNWKRITNSGLIDSKNIKKITL